MLNQDEWEDFQKLWRAKGLTSLREDIAYTNLEIQRLADELGKIRPADLKKLRRTVSEIEKVLEEYDESVDDVRAAVRAHAQTLEDLITFRSLSQELEAKQKHKRELVETENRKIIAGTKSITADRFLALALNWAQSIISNVKDRRERNACLDDLDRMVGLNVPGMPIGTEVLQALPEGEEDES
jgi:predicted  nucleic acid-binding Zn-ribbon protein